MKRGFTFIEIVFAISILALLALLLVNILPRAFDIYNEKFEEQERFSNVQIIFDRLAREIRQGNIISNISPATQTLGYLVLTLSSGGSVAYSTTLYNGKYYFTVNNEIQAGPIQELRFVGLDASGTYTTLISNIRTLSMTVVMEDGQKYASTISLRAETIPGAIVIIEIMYAPAPRDRTGNTYTETHMEFVEIYNETSNTLNLQGWKVNGHTISTIRSGSFNLPPGWSALIGANGSNLPSHYNVPSNTIVLETNSSGLGSGGGELNNKSDTVEVRDNNDRIIDRVQYDDKWGGKPSGNNYYSLVRKSIEDSSQDSSNWGNYPYINYTTGNITVYCLSAPLILISEVMYYPCPVDRNGALRPETNMEFVELYNAFNQTINIQNWSINNNVINRNVMGGFNIPPGGYAIIGGRNSRINSWYNIPSSYIYLTTQERGLGGGTLPLGNTSGSVILRDASGRVVDQVSYSNTWGGSPSGNYYYSLERRSYTVSAQDSTNWGSSTTINYSILTYRSYCTPGSKNSISP